MGFFSRLFRRDQKAMPEPGSAEFRRAVEGSALPGSTEMGQSGWLSASPSAPGEANVEVQAQAGAVSAESLIAAGVPPEQAQRAAAALIQLQQAFGGGNVAFGNVSVEQGPTQTLDLQGMQGLREQMEATLREHGVDPRSGQSLDASQVPGLQEALLKVLADNGVDISQYG